MKYFLHIAILTLLLSACGQKTSPTPEIKITAPVLDQKPAFSSKEKEMQNAGLVDVATLDDGIMIHLVYATPYNFMGKVLYHDIHRAYLQADVAQKLLKAYRSLKRIRPDLTFVVYDAGRPLSVQCKMWDLVKGTEWDYYVANPNKGGGMHNFGAAVDLSLIDCTGQALAMGTAYDYFGYEANTDKESELLKSGRITPRELENRLLLRKVMTESGFRTVKSEWWHFNSCSLDEAKQRYKVIE